DPNGNGVLDPSGANPELLELAVFDPSNTTTPLFVAGPATGLALSINGFAAPEGRSFLVRIRGAAAGAVNAYNLSITTNDVFDSGGSSNNTPGTATPLGNVVQATLGGLNVPHGDEDRFSFTTVAEAGNVSVS